MLTQDAINFEQIVESIRTFDSPVPGKPAHVEASDSIRDTMADLFHSIHKRDYNPDKCAYYMHPTTAKELYQSDEMMYIDVGEVPEFHGRPIRTHPTIPEDVTLFLAPDAITLGGKIYAPEIIAYAD
jgi:hypothetical protein